jgi:hypothetical protein
MLKSLSNHGWGCRGTRGADINGLRHCVSAFAEPSAMHERDQYWRSGGASSSSLSETAPNLCRNTPTPSRCAFEKEARSANGWLVPSRQRRAKGMPSPPSFPKLPSSGISALNAPHRPCPISYQPTSYQPTSYQPTGY